MFLFVDENGTNQWLLRVILKAVSPRIIEADDGMQVAVLPHALCPVQPLKPTDLYEENPHY